MCILIFFKPNLAAVLLTFISLNYAQDKWIYITDVKYSKDLIKFAQNSDLLVLDSTLSDDLKKEAAKTMHLTAKQAADIAKQAKVKKLVLTHFSQRYKSTHELEKQAKTIFKNTIAAKDFMTIEI